MSDCGCVNENLCAHPKPKRTAIEADLSSRVLSAPADLLRPNGMRAEPALPEPPAASPAEIAERIQQPLW